MKKTMFAGVLVLVMALAGLGPAIAGNGQGFLVGPVSPILSGTPFDLTGEVVGLVLGQGLELATIDGNVLIYGIGPYWYWESLGVDRPVPGDTLQVLGYIVDDNGTERYIAMTVIIGDHEVQLRDPETGRPLWRGKGA